MPHKTAPVYQPFAVLMSACADSTIESFMQSYVVRYATVCGVLKPILCTPGHWVIRWQCRWVSIFLHVRLSIARSRNLHDGLALSCCSSGVLRCIALPATSSKHASSDSLRRFRTLLESDNRLSIYRVVRVPMFHSLECSSIDPLPVVSDLFFVTFVTTLHVLFQKIWHSYL